MAGKSHWNESKVANGTYEIKIDNPRWYFEYIQQELADFNAYIYRGERDSSRLVESTLDRTMKTIGKKLTKATTSGHLKRFKMATRGRINQLNYSINTDEDWWALGQHYGLNTPLLDWTESPFVALFFAFESEKISTSGYRVVYAISKNAIARIKNTLTKAGKEYIEVVNPLASDNMRLVNQRGLFLSMPPSTDIVSYIQNNIPASDNKYSLIKIIIAEKDRERILTYLNKMNISRLTLFPDLSGASEYVNLKLKINSYSGN
jgi:FRG domain